MWLGRSIVRGGFVLALLCGSCAAAAQGVVVETRFHGVRPGDPGGTVGLRNPERGFRIETVAGESVGDGFYRETAHLEGLLAPGYSDMRWVMDAQRYEGYGLTLAQIYVYLNRYQDRDLAAEKLDAMSVSFDALRKAGLKAVLRFAYEQTMEETEGPTLEIIRRHLAQLKPLLRANADVIYVMQAGFVGAWGEWHSSAHKLEQDHAALAAVVAGVLDTLPEDRVTQVRVPKYKRWALGDPSESTWPTVHAENAFTDAPAARIGFHNDGFLAGKTCGGTWTEAPIFSGAGNPEFDFMTVESPYVPVDGELFWSDIDGRVDGFQAAVRMRLHHYSSFSLAHSYSGQEGKHYGIDFWMCSPITAEQVREARLPVSDGYFEDGEGDSVARTQFEYIRDHLGYRIELQSARFPRSVVSGEAVPVEVTLLNRGFSVLHNPRPVLLVLLDRAGRLVGAWPTDGDARRWQPFAPGDAEFHPLPHVVKGNVTAESPGYYQVGLWLPDASETLKGDARYAVRTANRDTPWWPGRDNEVGVNIMGWIEVAP